MRVLMLNYEYPPLGGGGGIATQSIADRLAARGHVVHVVTSEAPDGRPAGEARARPPVLSDGKPRLHRVPSPRHGVHEAGLRGAFGYLVGASRLLPRLVSGIGFDLVHVFFSLPTGALLPASIRREVPVVLSLRGSDVPGHNPYDRRLELTHRLLKPLTRWIWRRATRVVSVSSSLGRTARRTMPDLCYDVIGNGVDPDFFGPCANPRPNGRRPLTCLAVGRLVNCKGLADLICGFGLLERGAFRLEIVGSGPEEASLRTLSARLGLEHEVAFLGALDRRQVTERYRTADLFTMVPLTESFGIAFAEALAAGLPIVASSVGGIPDLVEHGRNGLLVEPRDPAAVGEAIRALGERPEERAAMAVRNRAKAEATLSWSAVTDAYLAIYADILSGRAPARVPEGPPRS